MTSLLTASQIHDLSGETISHFTTGETVYTVYQNDNYRWLTSNNNNLQSLMKLAEPTKVLMPVVKALLLPVKLPFDRLALGEKIELTGSQHKSDQQKIRCLNLGLGGGAIERNLSQHKNAYMTTVELLSEVVDMYSQYFCPVDNNNHAIYTQCALDYLTNNQEKFDLITCDLFAGEQHPDFLLSPSFYQLLAHSLNQEGCVSLNLSIDDEHTVLDLLIKSKTYFKHRAVADFNEFKNIVLYLSHSPFQHAQIAEYQNKMAGSLKRFIIVD